MTARDALRVRRACAAAASPSAGRSLAQAATRLAASLARRRCSSTALHATWTGRSRQRCGAARVRVRARQLTAGRTQGVTEDKQEPFVRLRLRDTPYSRAMWDHAFELEYEVLLGARDLGLQLTVRNRGGAGFAFTTALHTYFGVQDVREENVMLLVRAAHATCARPPYTQPLSAPPLPPAGLARHHVHRQAGGPGPASHARGARPRGLHSVRAWLRAWCGARSLTHTGITPQRPHGQGLCGVAGARGAGGGHRLHRVRGEHRRLHRPRGACAQLLGSLHCACADACALLLLRRCGTPGRATCTTPTSCASRTPRLARPCSWQRRVATSHAAHTAPQAPC